MKTVSNQLNKEIGIYSNLYGGIKELFHKEQATNIPQEDTLLDNLLESNNHTRGWKLLFSLSCTWFEGNE